MKIYNTCETLAETINTEINISKFGFIGKQCPFCACITVYIPENVREAGKLSLHENGNGLIQDLFPDMDKTIRETLISGLCPECQKKIFGE